MNDKKSKVEVDEASTFSTSPETDDDAGNTQANNPLHGVKLQTIMEN
jgi:hypothetical protein